MHFFKSSIWASGLCLALTGVCASAGAAPALASTLAPVPANAASVTSGKAAVQVSDAWAKASVPGQTVGAAYLTLTAQQAGLTLRALHTPAAQSVQMHEMIMQGDVMQMRAIESLDLPQGQALGFAPGGRHLMLMGLKHPLRAGQVLPLRLEFSNGQSLQLQLPVRSTAPVPVRAPAASAAHGAHAAMDMQMNGTMDGTMDGSMDGSMDMPHHH